MIEGNITPSAMEPLQNVFWMCLHSLNFFQYLHTENSR